MSAMQINEEDTLPMSFCENQHGNFILETLRSQRESGKFCDVTLYVDNKKFHLHRNILTSFSPYFESIIQSKKTLKEKFNITCQSAEIVQCFVNYMYTGTIVIDRNNVAELFKLAHRLEVAKLKFYCCQYLEKYLNLTNCLSVKDMADRYSMPHLSNLATEYIHNHLNEVLSSSEILDLDVNKLEKFLSDRTFSLSQLQVFQIVINWTKRDVQKRERQLKSILKLVRWTEMDMQHISDVIENDNLFVMSELALYLVLSHLSNNGLSFDKFHSVLDTLTEKYSHIQNETEVEEMGTICKVRISKKKFKKKQRLLRANPIARLAALRAALVLRTRKISTEKYLLRKEVMRTEFIDENSLKCHLCNHCATDATSLEQHLSIVHSREVTYKCGVCGFVCQWNNLYLQHVKGHFPGPPYKCDSCEFTSDKLNTVLTHRSSHSQEKLHRCQHCNYRSKSQANILLHSRCHLGQYQATDKNSQQTSDRSYVCDLCGFSSKYLSHLIAHKRIHSGDAYNHQGVRPHCCSVCGRGFLEKSHLVRHERIHLEEKPFKCQECDYASSRRDKLKEHQARHHGDNASAKVPYKARPTKKPNQLFPEAYNDPSAVAAAAASAAASAAATAASARMQHQQPNGNELADILAQNQNVTPPNLNSYPTFNANEAHVQHPAAAASSTLDFHHQQLLNSANNRVKDHSAGASMHRATHQSSAAAVAAAMMLDPRFHHGNAGTVPYSTPPVSMATMVNQTAGQMVQSGHQMGEYPTALMSLF